MKKTSWLVLAIFIALLCPTQITRAQSPAPKVRAAEDGLALTPPMGWYPWNEFGQDPQNEKLIKEIADALISSGLKDAGYAYVGPDEGKCFSRGADGKLTTNQARYPERPARSGRLYPPARAEVRTLYRRRGSDL